MPGRGTTYWPGDDIERTAHQPTLPPYARTFVPAFLRGELEPAPGGQAVSRLGKLHANHRFSTSSISW